MSDRLAAAAAAAARGLACTAAGTPSGLTQPCGMLAQGYTTLGVSADGAEAGGQPGGSEALWSPDNSPRDKNGHATGAGGIMPCRGIYQERSKTGCFRVISKLNSVKPPIYYDGGSLLHTSLLWLGATVFFT
jgi:hypothetical protein